MPLGEGKNKALKEFFINFSHINKHIKAMIKYQCGNNVFFFQFIISFYFSLHIKRKKVIIISLGGTQSLIFSTVPFIEFEECSLFFSSLKYFNIERVLKIPTSSCVH